MKIEKLQDISKIYFGYDELARTLGISMASARVSASRYVKAGLLVRIKRNLYVLRETWNTATTEQKFQFANLCQTPSYISLMTALDYYSVTTQMQRDYFESIALQRTKTISIKATVFQYSKISKELYFGFEKVGDIFIACPEKALLDAFYLFSYGRYALDFSAIDRGKLNLRKMESMLTPYPIRTRNLLRRYGYL
jgi:predicted transcriptional regulator of viral defense system